MYGRVLNWHLFVLICFLPSFLTHSFHELGIHPSSFWAEHNSRCAIVASRSLDSRVSSVDEWGQSQWASCQTRWHTVLAGWGETRKSFPILSWWCLLECSNTPHRCDSPLLVWTNPASGLRTHRPWEGNSLPLSSASHYTQSPGRWSLSVPPPLELQQGFVEMISMSRYMSTRRFLPLALLRLYIDRVGQAHHDSKQEGVGGAASTRIHCSSTVCRSAHR